MKALDDPNLMRQIGRGRSPSLRTADRGARIHGRVRPGPVRREGPAPAQAGPQAFVTCEENEEEKQSDDGMTPRTDNERADPHSAAARRCRPAPVCRGARSMCAWTRGASAGRSRWDRAPWAGSSRRTSGSASGSRRAAAMTGVRHMAALGCENDVGGRCTLWPSGDAHGTSGLSAGGVASYASAAGSVSAARAAPTGTGATQQAEGLVRVRGQVCIYTPAPRPLGSLPIHQSLAGRPPSAAKSAADQRTGPAS